MMVGTANLQRIELLSDRNSLHQNQRSLSKSKTEHGAFLMSHLNIEEYFAIFHFIKLNLR